MKNSFSNRTRIFLAVLLLPQIILMALTINRPIGSSTMAISLPPILPNTADPLIVEGGLVSAKAQAASWRPDAELMAVSMQIDWPLSIESDAPIALAPGGWITYTFAAPSYSTGNGNSEPFNVDATLSLLFERRSGSLVHGEVLEWQGSTDVFPFTNLPYTVTSSTAVTTLELVRGQTWRAACPQYRHTTRVNLAHHDDQIWWVVSYSDTRTGVAALQGEVNVQSGELANIIDRSQPCS